MIELALVSLAPLPAVMTFVVVAFTVNGLVLKVTVGALSVPATAMLSRAFPALPTESPEPQAARSTSGRTMADTTDTRDRRTLMTFDRLEDGFTPP